jgi:hypothetical protein
VFRRLKELTELDAGWDSYGANKIQQRTASLAYQVLAEPMFTAMAPPALVPTSIGGVQAEWRHGSRALEIEFVSPFEMEVLYSDDQSDDPDQEVRIDVDLTPLQELIGQFVR